MIPRAAPAHLTRLAEASPRFLVAEGVVDPSPIASAALHVWILAPRGENMLIHPLGTRAPEMAATVPLPSPPVGTIGLVAPDWQPLAALGTWWSAAEGLPPPFVPASSGAEALPGVLAMTAEALSAALLREAAAVRAEGSAEEPDGILADEATPPPAPRALDWAKARALKGGVDSVAIGDEALRPLLRAPAQGRSILLLPDLGTRGMRRLRITLAHGTGRGAAVAAWIRPGGPPPDDLTDLSHAVPGSAWTGWRPIGEDAVTLDLAFQPRLGEEAMLAVGLRAGEAEAVVELEAGTLSAEAWPEPTKAPLPVAAPWANLQPLEAMATGPWPPAAPQDHPTEAPSAGGMAIPGTLAGGERPRRLLATGAQYEGLRLNDYENDGTYRHLELDMAALRTGRREWAPVRLKFAIEEGEPRLEFRLAAGWPAMFEEWLGRQSDRFGPFLRVFQSDIQEFLELVSDERDAALMAALLEILPRVVEEGCHRAGVAAAEIPGWLAAAQALRAEGTRSA
ncbi:hypothetical protein D9599_18985 [Roseomonas sp. KE2513]|uniref:DUF6212 domain-containing protein n=1 Tax=Roseomonas sp. KE2513 TaxID=2479202 RepID=UPI0018DFF645|nr:DUF6212 domain-containing protein [Roseomonas sp. KE2513]MBI0537648.1 hypothetical protein [Roseomonas sp. KE2513]